MVFGGIVLSMEEEGGVETIGKIVDTMGNAIASREESFSDDLHINVVSQFHSYKPEVNSDDGVSTTSVPEGAPSPFLGEII